MSIDLRPRRRRSTRTSSDHPLRPAVLIAALLLLAPVSLTRPAAAQDAPTGAAAMPEMPDLVAALRASPGVLGVDAAMTRSGKQVIFAWFENKQAVVRWYYSETHRMVRDMFVAERPPHTPLEHVADDVGPILVVASLTPAPAGRIDGLELPVVQIAIELYQPLPGGLSVGGRFGPAEMPVPGMIEVPIPQP